ncbi:endonuclease I [Variovorax sp. RKNM96]|uniref:hypothetical protein n=1 Tax=Variovorax sp. RKNM96 TaxID=2681552 RepID=UPI001980C0A3|nr:hypothetical protein [Variovorax sp. RKNM96]QSI31452.1 endonuclease I [Variovorax sp. RKNM96]
MTTSKGRPRTHIAASYRSGLEEKVANQLRTAGIPHEYETRKLGFIKPESAHTYCPDFWIGSMVVETKGLMDSDDRAKHLLIKAQYPDLDLRFVFSNSRTKLYKGSKTTYADWCRKHDYKFADKLIPADWLIGTQTKEPK